MIFDSTPQIPLSLSDKEAEYLLELLKEEKEVLEPFYDQVEWAQERLDMLDALIERIEREI
jgi:hypothetical protein